MSESQLLQLPLIDIRRWHYGDAGLFLRDELLAVIRQHGGVTDTDGVRRDGRLLLVRRSPAYDPSPYETAALS